MKPTEHAFEQHPELKESIQHAATFWKTDSTWSYHLNQINKVCEELHEAQAAISQMQPEWVAVNSPADLPTDNQSYWCEMKDGTVECRDGFTIRRFGALRYTPFVKPQPPTK